MKNKTIWQGPQDFMKPTGQHVNLLFNLRPECPHHLQFWVFSLLSQQATSLWGHGQFPHVTVQVRTAQHSSFTKLRPWLGSYEGCSFICSSLWLRRKRTVKLGVHVRNLSPCEKLREGRGEGEETDKKVVIPLTSFFFWPASCSSLNIQPYPS